MKRMVDVKINPLTNIVESIDGASVSGEISVPPLYIHHIPLELHIRESTSDNINNFEAYVDVIINTDTKFTSQTLRDYVASVVKNSDVVYGAFFKIYSISEKLETDSETNETYISTLSSDACLFISSVSFKGKTNPSFEASLEHRYYTQNDSNVKTYTKKKVIPLPSNSSSYPCWVAVSSYNYKYVIEKIQ